MMEQKRTNCSYDLTRPILTAATAATTTRWADDKYWLPVFLQGKKFEGLFEFDDESIILKHTLKEVQQLPPLPTTIPPPRN